jgi:hypothetical protein
VAEPIVFCPGCGRKREDGYEFCPGCGRSYGQPSRPVGTGISQTPQWGDDSGNPVVVRVLARGIFVGIVVLFGIYLLLWVVPALTLPNVPLPKEPMPTIPMPTPILPPYQARSFSIPPGQNTAFPLTDIRSGQTIEGYFVITGGNDDVGFAIQGPSGGYLERSPRVVGRHDFSLHASTDGVYTLVFDNSSSVVTGRVVTMEIRAY